MFVSGYLAFVWTNFDVVFRIVVFRLFENVLGISLDIEMEAVKKI